MTEAKAKRKASQSFIKSLNTLQATCEETAKQFGVPYVPLDFLSKAIESGMTNEVKGKGGESANEVIRAHNKVLSSLQILCEKTAANMSSPNVPIAILKSAIKQIKSSYLQGLK